MNKDVSLPKIKLNNISVTMITLLILTFLIFDKTLLVENMQTALPVYIITCLSILFLFGYLFKFGLPTGKVKYVLAFAIIYYLYIVLYSLQTLDIGGLNYSVRLIVYLSILFIISLSIIDKKKIVIIGSLFSGFIIIIFVDWIQIGETFKYTGFFNNPNTLGIVVYNILFFHLLALLTVDRIVTKMIFVSFIIIDLFLIFVSTSRAVWFALIIAFIVCILWKVISKNKTIYRLTFFIIIIGVFVFSYIYPKLYTMEIGWKLDEILINITGKSLFSGRQVLWSNIIGFIESKPYFGYGVTKTPSDFMSTDLSTHNTFLSILLQTGIVGVVLYCTLLYLIWDALYPIATEVYNEKKPLLLFSAFFISLITYQMFELSFIQGGYSIDIFEWLFISIGISINIATIKKNR